MRNCSRNGWATSTNVVSTEAIYIPAQEVWVSGGCGSETVKNRRLLLAAALMSPPRPAVAVNSPSTQSQTLWVVAIGLSLLALCCGSRIMCSCLHLASTDPGRNHVSDSQALS